MGGTYFVHSGNYNNITLIVYENISSQRESHLVQNNRPFKINLPSKTYQPTGVEHSFLKVDFIAVHQLLSCWWPTNKHQSESKSDRETTEWYASKIFKGKKSQYFMTFIEAMQCSRSKQ